MILIISKITHNHICFHPHGLRSPWSMFAHADFCIVCLRLFHCRTRVINHVRGSARCARAIADAEIAPPCDELVRTLAVQDSQDRKALCSVSSIIPALKRPCIQLQGPLPYWAGICCCPSPSCSCMRNSLSFFFPIIHIKNKYYNNTIKNKMKN